MESLFDPISISSSYRSKAAVLSHLKRLYLRLYLLPLYIARGLWGWWGGGVVAWWGGRVVLGSYLWEGRGGEVRVLETVGDAAP